MKKIIKTLLVVMVVVLALAAFTACEMPNIPGLTPTTPECTHEGTVEYVPGKNSTCTEDGLTSGFRCTACGEEIVPQEVDPAEHHWVDADCTNPKTCSVCKLTEGEALGHSFTVDVEALAPTCEESGYTAHKACDRCDALDESYAKIEALGHAYTEPFVYQAPTCTDKGILAVACPVCEGAWIAEYIEALGHDMAPATCEKPSTCKNEGCEHTEGEALGHNLVDVEEKAPTCTEDGYTAHKACDREGCEYTEGKEVKAAGHSLVYTVTAPTATATGKTVVTCSACENFETITYGEVSAMLPGTYVFTAGDEGLAGTAEKTYTDGQVYVHNNVWEMHLSAKFKVDGSKKTFADETYLETRLNYGGKTEFKSNGYIKNGIVFTTTCDTTVTIYWVQGGDDHRQVALYDLEGNIVVQSDDQTSGKNDPVMTTFTVPAGTYVLGNVVNTNYHFKVVVEVVDPVLVDGTITNKTISDNLTYITNNASFPNPSFYADGGLKMNYVNQGVSTASFEAQSSVKVTLSFNAMNDNTKSENADVDAFTVYGLDAEGNVVATASTNTITDLSTSVVLNGEGIVSVKVIMTDYYHNGNNCVNLSLSGVLVEIN